MNKILKKNIVTNWRIYTGKYNTVLKTNGCLRSPVHCFIATQSSRTYSTALSFNDSNICSAAFIHSVNNSFGLNAIRILFVIHGQSYKRTRLLSSVLAREMNIVNIFLSCFFDHTNASRHFITSTTMYIAYVRVRVMVKVNQ